VRATRGLFGSVGVSLTLIAAAACTLLAVSAVVALRGWPSLSSDTLPKLSVSASVSTPGHHSSGAAPILVGTGAPAAAPGARATNAGRPSRSSSGPTTHALTLARQPAGSATPASLSAGSSTQGPATASRGDLVTRVGHAVAGTLSGASGTVGAVVGKVSPAVGQAVGRSGSAAGDGVSAAGQTAGSTVAHLVGALASQP
jgi:trimeric autotransporter adhesin